MREMEDERERFVDSQFRVEALMASVSWGFQTAYMAAKSLASWVSAMFNSGAGSLAVRGIA